MDHALSMDHAFAMLASRAHELTHTFNITDESLPKLCLNVEVFPVRP